MLSRFSTTRELFRRLFATGAIGVVLALGIFAANPGLHEELHETHADSDKDCPIVLFANGVTLAVGAIAVLLPAIKWVSRTPALVERLALASPRYLLQPERGPPAY